MSKIGVILDGDGHFQVAKIDDRPAMIKLLKKIEDGDAWDNMAEEYFSEYKCEHEIDLLHCDEDDWIGFISEFIQRGSFEITDMS